MRNVAMIAALSLFVGCTQYESAQYKAVTQASEPDEPSKNAQEIARQIVISEIYPERMTVVYQAANHSANVLDNDEDLNRAFRKIAKSTASEINDFKDDFAAIQKYSDEDDQLEKTNQLFGEYPDDDRFAELYEIARTRPGRFLIAQAQKHVLDAEVAALDRLVKFSSEDAVVEFAQSKLTKAEERLVSVLENYHRFER